MIDTTHTVVLHAINMLANFPDFVLRTSHAPAGNAGGRVKRDTEVCRAPKKTMTSTRRAPVRHSRVADATNAATVPLAMPSTIESGPCAADQAALPEPRTAKLMHSVYPVIAIASSKLAAATTVAGMAAPSKPCQVLHAVRAFRMARPGDDAKRLTW